MTKVHAVIFARGAQAWISIEHWANEENEVGIENLADLSAEFDGLRAVAGNNLSTPGHQFLPSGSEGGLEFTDRNPHIVVFRLGDTDWVARGFRPWGSVLAGGDNGVQVLLVTSADAGVEFELARSVAGLLYHMRQDPDLPGLATQSALALANPIPADSSLIFPLSDNVSAEVQDAGNAADHGGAADSDT
jgi:hypothetical protein